jgi:hypothetical protein
MKRLLVTAILLLAPAVRAGDPVASDFALVIGVNQAAESRLQALRYADDDAARYRDLFRTLGARTFLLATLDDNTRRLHPEAAAEAMAPRDRNLDKVVEALAAGVAAAQRSGLLTTLYVVYAGHGEVEGETGYLTLEDARLTGPALATRVLDRVRADRTHVIVDACSSYFFAAGRGSSGKRRPISGFSRLGGTLVEDRDVGLLLSTSSARESHEWAAFQAGVFSHEVRSGMFGAADADGNGIVSYGEMAAFIKRANQSIPNEKYRPEVFWRPPRGSAALVDLRPALARRVEIAPEEEGHYYLEDPSGVRLADLHKGRRTVRLLRPGQGAPRLYLRRTRDDREFVLPAASPVVTTTALTPQEPHVNVRSAAHEAFSAIFSLPFDQSSVDEVLRRQEGLLAAPAEREPPRLGARRTAGLVLLGVSGLAVAGGTWAHLSARSLRGSIDGNTSQDEVAALNRRIESRNDWALAAASAAGASAIAGALLLLWPDAPPVSASVSSTGMMVEMQSRF